MPENVEGTQRKPIEQEEGDVDLSSDQATTEQKRVSIGEEGLEKLMGQSDESLPWSELTERRVISVVYIDRRKYLGEKAARGGAQRQPGRQSDRGTGPGGPLQPISEAELHKLRQVYVETKEDEALRLLITRSLAVLSGPEDSGRRATALYLLDQLPLRGYYELSPDITLGQVAEMDIPPSTGLFIESPTKQMFGSFGRYDLRALMETLDNSVLVISTSVLPSDLAGFLREVAVRRELPVTWGHSGQQHRQEMLRRHLALFTGCKVSDARVRDALADEEIAGLLADELCPSEIDRLAELLEAADVGEISRQEALDRFQRRVREEVKSWFAQGHPLERCMLLVAAAVFNEAPYSDVVEAGKRLREMFAGETKEESQETGQNRPQFSNPREKRLENIGARITAGHVTAEYGQSPVDLLTLNNASWQPEVLRYLFCGDIIRSELLEWLKNYGGHSMAHMRHRAAAAVGELSRHDFSLVRRRVLLPWAKSSRAEERVSAGIALGIAAWDSAVAAAALGLLHHWATLDNWRLQWTAAEAYGGLVGMRYPARALSDLETIAEADDVRLVPPILWSLEALYTLGADQPEVGFSVLETLHNWAGLRRSPAEAVALLAVINVADWIVPPNNPGEGWPLLLHQTSEDRETESLVADLLRQAMNYSKGFRMRLLGEIQDWLRLAADQENLQEAIQSLLERMAREGNERDRRQLLYWLERWSRRRTDTLDAAAIIHARLLEIGP